MSELALKERNAGVWLQSLISSTKEKRSYFKRTYGPSSQTIIVQKRTLLMALLKTYIKLFGDNSVLITRAPGRLNIMGRHIDHQGGRCSTMAINRDVFMVVGHRPRDNQVHLHNLESKKFLTRTFFIENLVRELQGQKWQDFIRKEKVRKSLSPIGDWSHYIKAAVARFQLEQGDLPLKGMNIVAAGDIPVAAGLGSSSALVVAAAEAIIEINDLKMPPSKFVKMCGQAERYVGTRGGAGDHAALKFSREGKVTQIEFFPFKVTDTVEFPRDNQIFVCNSGIEAHKTTNARDVYNHRVACYDIGRELFKKRFPQFAPRIKHLRDINMRNLAVSYSVFLEMLKRIPVSLTRQEVIKTFGENKAERFLNSHSSSISNYPIRPVVVFGLAENERSRVCSDLLRKGDGNELGRLMNLSHNGDRVVAFNRDGIKSPFKSDYSDSAVDKLITREKAEPRVSSLADVSGAYGCSIPQLDRMVDIALSVRGVKGAQMAGAGLGGCMMVLVEKGYGPELERAMIQQYYKPFSIKPDILEVFPVAGSGPIIVQ